MRRTPGACEEASEMAGTELRLPVDFGEDPWDVRGCCTAELVHRGQLYVVNFYDPTRLAQTIEDDLATDAAFFEENMIVVRTINRRSVEDAVGQLVKSGQVHRLLPSEE